MRRLRCAIALLAACVSSNAINAQQLRGIIVEADGTTPAPGTVVMLVHPSRSDSVLARTIANARGEFTLTLAKRDSVKVRALRIGYDPVEAGPLALDAGAPRTITLMFTARRATLAAVTIADKNRCDVRPGGAERVAGLFMDVKAALFASTVDAMAADERVESVGIVETRDLHGALLAPATRTPSSLANARPYESIGIAALTRRGYVVPDGDGTLYHAPDAGVLVSDAFASQHCLSLEEGHDSTAALVGIHFRPVGRPRNLVEISGTLWVDATTNELRYLDYAYENLPATTRNVGLGGRVAYTRVSDGRWLIDHWAIRTPLLALAPLGGVLSMRGRAPRTPVVVAVRSIGGELQRVAAADGTVIYQRSGALVSASSPPPVTTPPLPSTTRADSAPPAHADTAIVARSPATSTSTDSTAANTGSYIRIRSRTTTTRTDDSLSITAVIHLVRIDEPLAAAERIGMLVRAGRLRDVDEIGDSLVHITLTAPTPQLTEGEYIPNNGLRSSALLTLGIVGGTPVASRYPGAGARLAAIHDGTRDTGLRFGVFGAVIRLADTTEAVRILSHAVVQPDSSAALAVDVLANRGPLGIAALKTLDARGAIVQPGAQAAIARLKQTSVWP